MDDVDSDDEAGNPLMGINTLFIQLSREKINWILSQLYFSPLFFSFGDKKPGTFLSVKKPGTFLSVKKARNSHFLDGPPCCAFEGPLCCAF